MGAVGAGQRLEYLKCGKQAPELGLVLTDVADDDARRGVVAKEELEQELVTGRIVAVGNGEPVLKAGVTSGSYRIFLPVGS